MSRRVEVGKEDQPQAVQVTAHADQSALKKMFELYLLKHETELSESVTIADGQQVRKITISLEEMAKRLKEYFKLDLDPARVEAELPAAFAELMQDFQNEGWYFYIWPVSNQDRRDNAPTNDN